MGTSLEITVFRLMLGASFFTKLILLLLLTFSIFSWALMLHKYLFINNYSREISRFLKITTNQGTLDAFEETCASFAQSDVKTVPVILLKLIRSRQLGRRVLSPETIINNAVMHENNRLQQGMVMLATIANISPLIGLLGTVWGVMAAFINIGQQGSATIATVAPGIAEALITTIAGLIVAVPALGGHNYLSTGINKCIDQLERINEMALSLFEKEMS